MSKILEIFGRAVGINTAGLIWNWLTAAVEADSEHRNLSEILELVSMGNFGAACEETKKHLLEKPDCINGRMAAVAICLETGDIAGAIKNLQSVYYRQPNNTIALYVMGYCYERLGKEAEAMAFYQDCLKFKNYLEMPRQRLAAIYLKNRQIERAIEEYKQLQIEYPDDIRTFILLGHLYMFDGDCESAKDAFNDAILVHPDNFSSSAESQQIKEMMDGYDGDYQVVEYINNLIEQNPQAADLHIQLGDILLKAEEVTDAAMAYEKALKLQPNYLEAAVKLGTTHIGMGNEMIAAEKFNRAVDINDEIVDAYIGLSESEILSGQEERAYLTLELAGAIQQNSCVLFAETARLRVMAAMKQENEFLSLDDENQDSAEPGKMVIDAFQKEYRNNPGNQAVAYGLGLIYMRFKKYEQAREIFSGVLDINPTHHRARSRSAICSMELGQKLEALSCIGNHTEINSEMINLHYKTAVLYSDRKRFISALDKANQALSAAFDTEENAATLIEVLQNLGVMNRAFACWNTLGEMTRLAVGTSE
ncbi:MAG: tetratricopeptide repeat protein [Anaerohalosphaeraceae bacterium]|nr:tetratricopeptide repeat protein [Anaerohalosphaeraceae bacterium]